MEIVQPKDEQSSKKAAMQMFLVIAMVTVVVPNARILGRGFHKDDVYWILGGLGLAIIGAFLTYWSYVADGENSACVECGKWYTGVIEKEERGEDGSLTEYYRCNCCNYKSSRKWTVSDLESLV